MLNQSLFHIGQCVDVALCRHLCHLQPGVATGIDVGKWRQIHVDVEAEAVIAATVPNPQPERSDFLLVDINARCVDPALTVTGREIFTRERTSMFATLGPKPPDMQATLERSARAPSWQGPKSGWATHLLPKRPGAFAESLCGKTSRPITARERDEYLLRGVAG